MTNLPECSIYLFCIAKADLLPDIKDPGLNDESPLILQPFGDLTAVICEIKTEEFVGESAEEHLKDLNWVGPRAMRHQQIIQQVMAVSPVLPLGFSTLVSSRASLIARLQRHQSAVRGFFEDTARNQEWSLKGLLARKEAQQSHLDQAIIDHQAALDKLPRGRRYMEEQRLRQQVSGLRIARRRTPPVAVRDHRLQKPSPCRWPNRRDPWP